jgi:hypothetical protein
MIKIDHTTFAKNPAFGYYSIGEKIFWDKASALLSGSELGHKYSDLKWCFNDEAFSKFNWQDEPPGSIRDYYHIRAKQLREKYDYLILNLSGGSDSTTVLYSFIQQGLFIDEVVVCHSTRGQKAEASNLNFHSSNEFSEFEYAAKPLLKWLSKVSPKTIITIRDFSEDVLESDTYDENFIHWTGDFITPGCIVRYSHASNIDHLRNFDKGKQVGIIFGIDKPRVVLHNGMIYTFFVDRAVHVAIPSLVNNGFTNTQVELFFWSPELPQLVIKQAHIVKKWFELPHNQRLSYMLDSRWQVSPANRTTYEATIKGVIYPDYDLTTFQTNKPVTAMFQEWDNWMHDYKDSAGYKTFMRGIEHIYNKVDKDFFMIKANLNVPGTEIQDMNWEYRPCFSKKYAIGLFKKNDKENLF